MSQASQPTPQPQAATKITASSLSELSCDHADVSYVNAAVAFNKIKDGNFRRADAHFRTAISRAYYALLHHAIHYAVKHLSFERPTEGTHGLLRKCYGEAARQRNRRYRTVQKELGELQRFRESTDYDDEFLAEDIDSLQEAYFEVVKRVNEAIGLL